MAGSTPIRSSMSKLEDIVRFETANSGLAFRKSPYGKGERDSLLIDVLALANARVDGPRLLVLGVRDEVGGKRGLKGVNSKVLPKMFASYKHIVGDCIEPALEISLRTVAIQERTLAVLVLRDCGDQPYLLSKDVSQELRKGDGWIRRGGHQSRLGRDDMRGMFRTQTQIEAAVCEMQVAFDGATPTSTIELPVLPLTSKPSDQARKRIHGLLEAKKAAHDRLGRTDTWVDRLAFARVHGADQPYETQSPLSLLEQLGQSEEEHAAADQYYEYELRAHKLNLAVVNLGDGPLSNATLTVDVPTVDGVEVADHIYPPVGVDAADVGPGYPGVDLDEDGAHVAAAIDRVNPGARVQAFRRSLRLLLREPAANTSLTLRYTLTGKGLKNPVTGELRINVTEGEDLRRTSRRRA